MSQHQDNQQETPQRKNSSHQNYEPAGPTQNLVTSIHSSDEGARSPRTKSNHSEKKEQEQKNKPKNENLQHERTSNFDIPEANSIKDQRQLYESVDVIGSANLKSKEYTAEVIAYEQEQQKHSQNQDNQDQREQTQEEKNNYLGHYDIKPIVEKSIDENENEGIENKPLQFNDNIPSKVEEDNSGEKETRQPQERREQEYQEEHQQQNQEYKSPDNDQQNQNVRYEPRNPVSSERENEQDTKQGANIEDEQPKNNYIETDPQQKISSEQPHQNPLEQDQRYKQPNQDVDVRSSNRSNDPSQGKRVSQNSNRSHKEDNQHIEVENQNPQSASLNDNQPQNPSHNQSQHRHSVQYQPKEQRHSSDHQRPSQQHEDRDIEIKQPSQQQNNSKNYQIERQQISPGKSIQLEVNPLDSGIIHIKNHPNLTVQVPAHSQQIKKVVHTQQNPQAVSKDPETKIQSTPQPSTQLITKKSKPKREQVDRKESSTCSCLLF